VEEEGVPSVRAMATAPEPFHRRVLVVEDEPMTAALLERVLVGEGFQVECVADVAQARVSVRDFDPDCALIDISLGVGPSGADLAHVLHHERPDVALLFLTRHPDLRTAGLTDDQVPPNCGFVRKDRVSNPAYLISAIEQVLGDHARDVRDDTDPARPLGELTEHQMEVLRLIALGYTNETIATIKGAGRSTVERWVAGILQAMGIHSRGEINPRVEAVRRYVAVAGVPHRP
jgi:DNA-binding NarL/FixJ family response regulator